MSRREHAIHRVAGFLRLNFPCDCTTPECDPELNEAEAIVEIVIEAVRGDGPRRGEPGFHEAAVKAFVDGFLSDWDGTITADRITADRIIVGDTVRKEFR